MAATNSFCETLKQIPGKLLKFPVELLLALTFFGMAMIGLEGSMSRFENTFYVFFPLFVLTYSLNRPGWKWKIPYILSYFLWIPIMLYYKNPGAELLAAYLLSVILLSIGKVKKDNTGYAFNALHVVKYFALSCLIGGVLVALIFAIFLSVEALFGGGDSFMEAAARVSVFAIVVILPMLSCVFVGGQEPEEKPSKVIGAFINYIFTPALLIYTVILFAYSLKILFTWTLPQGGVAYMVIAYMGIAIVCYWLSYAADKLLFGWFYRWLPLFVAPFLILLWAGTLRRVIDYGFTEERVYLMTLVVLVTVFDVLMFFARTRDFQKMTISLGVAAFVLSFIPGIRAKDLGIWSQQLRFETVLPLITEDGKFVIPDYAALAKDADLAKAWRSAKEISNYLLHNMSDAKYSDKYGNLGHLEFSESNLDKAKKDLG